MTGPAAQGGVLSIVPPPSLPHRGGSGGGVILFSPPCIVILVVLLCPTPVSGLSHCGRHGSCSSSSCAAAAATVIPLTISIAECRVVTSLAHPNYNCDAPPPLPSMRESSTLSGQRTPSSLPSSPSSALATGTGDYNLGRWDVRNCSTFFASCICCPHSSAPPPPLSACVLANPPPSLIVGRPCPSCCTASNQTTVVNPPSHSHHCFGIPPNCNHAHCGHFCCHSIDIGDNAYYHPPLSCALVAPPSWPHPAPNPRPSASKHLCHFPATNCLRCLCFGG